MIVFEGVYHKDRLQNAVLERSGSLTEALCESNRDRGRIVLAG